MIVLPNYLVRPGCADMYDFPVRAIVCHPDDIKAIREHVEQCEEIVKLGEATWPSTDE